MKPGKQWYLLAYDIRDPRRLRRFHYRISKLALPLQESVFLLQADPEGLAALRELVKQLTHSRQDDLRLYPVTHPGAIWTAGLQKNALRDLYPARKPSPSLISRLGHLLHLSSG